MAKQRESRISAAMIKWLGARGWKAWKNAGSMFQEAGRPDVMAIKPDGSGACWMVCIETKVDPKAGPTPLQQRWLDDAAAHGADAFCAHSVEELEREMRKRRLA